MNYEYNDLLIGKEAKNIQDGGKIDNSASDRWSTEVEELFDNKYHRWIGQKLNREGVWVDDNNVNKLMNEACASYLIEQISSRFNKNINFSLLEEKEIIWMIADMLEDVNNILIEKYEDFNVKPEYFSSIINQVKSTTYGLLKIPFHGLMRMHLGDKNKTIISKHENAEVY